MTSASATPNETEAIQFPDQSTYAAKWGAVPSPYGNFQYLNPDDENCKADFCHPDFALDGFPGTPPKPGQMPLADFVTYNDAIIKMNFIAKNRKATGQPFFLVTGIKRPHLNWRSPAGYTQYVAAALLPCTYRVCACVVYRRAVAVAVAVAVTVVGGS